MPSNRIKRKRLRKRTDEDGDPEFQVAPMVDVLLVLMLFFMSITSTELLKKERNLQLAHAKDAKRQTAEDKINEIVINISWNHTNNTAGFSMDGQPYPDADSLTPVLADRIASHADRHYYVLLRADKDVEYSNVSDMMRACGNAGIDSVSFAVIIGGGKNSGSAPADASTSHSS
jgi:biopolymer transport protein ExbD